MVGEFIRSVLVVLLWVGLWGITEMVIDKIARDNIRIRFVVYVLITIISAFLIWIWEIPV